MTQYVSNPNGTSNLAGWSESGDGTITSTADGVQFKSTGTGSGRYCRVLALTKTSSQTFGVYTLSGIQIRRNSASGQITTAGVYDTVAGTTAYVPMTDVDLPQGQFVALPNVVYADVGLSNSTIYVIFYVADGAAFDFTIKGARLYDKNDNPADPVALDTNDSGYTYAQGVNSLGATFTRASGNEAAASVTWAWGDGTANSTGAASSKTTGTYAGSKAHYFPTAGKYTVTLTSKEPQCVGYGTQKTPTTASTSQVVSVPSGSFTAGFTYSPNYLSVDVDASSSIAQSNDPIDSYTWSWGDGSANSTGSFQSHTYAQAGTYNITLTIRTNETLRTSTKVIAVSVTAPPAPNLYFTLAKNLLDVDFTSSIAGAPSYLWDFGDGTTSTLEAPSHSFSAPGTYAVTVTTSSLTTTQNVTVSSTYTPIANYQDALRLEVAVPYAAGTVYNRLANPNGEQGGYGWVTPVVGSSIKGSNTDSATYDHGISGWKLVYTSSGSGTQTFYSEAVSVVVGQYVVGAAVCPYVDGYYRMTVQALNATGTVLGSSATTGYLSALGTLQRTTPYLLPSGTTQARLRVDHYSTTSAGTPATGKVLLMRRTVLATGSTSASVASVTYTENQNWTDILGQTHQIAIEREELNIGTLGATVLDASLDPAVSGTIRPGQAVRLRVVGVDDGGNTTLESVYTGTLTEAAVSYQQAKRPGAQDRTEITLSAIDNVSELARRQQANGVATIADLPGVLEGMGVPYLVNGSSAQVPTPVVVTVNENASALDQVAITRDVQHGVAFVNRNNVLVALDSANLPVTPTALLDERAYSAFDATFSTNDCINSVTVVFLRYTAATGTDDAKTEEITYGPYEDQSSIAEWGYHSATFRYQALSENPAAISGYASAILAANAQPAVRMNSVTLPVRHGEDLDRTRALMDLCDLVTVKNVKTGVSEQSRVKSLKHTITPDRWSVDVTFSDPGTVAAPQQVASPPAVAVSTTGGKYSGQGVMSASLTTTTTEADGAGMTLTVPVTSTAQVFMVSVVLDIAANSATSSNFIGQLYVGGAAQTRQFVKNMPLSGLRVDAAQQWRVTGLTPGNVVFKFACRSATSGATHTVRTPHSAITIWEV